MLDWLEQRGVETHAEKDGRMFPITNDSQTIIDCFTQAAKYAGVTLWTQSEVTFFSPLKRLESRLQRR